MRCLPRETLVQPHDHSFESLSSPSVLVPPWQSCSLAREHQQTKPWKITLQKTPDLLVILVRKFASGISTAKQSPCDRLPQRLVQGVQQGRQSVRVCRFLSDREDLMAFVTRGASLQCRAGESVAC